MSGSGDAVLGCCSLTDAAVRHSSSRFPPRVSAQVCTFVRDQEPVTSGLSGLCAVLCPCMEWEYLQCGHIQVFCTLFCTPCCTRSLLSIMR